MRVIVTDSVSEARSFAAALQDIAPREEAVNGLPVFACDWSTTRTRLFAIGGLPSRPSGAPPTWQVTRRAAAKALGILARDASSLVVVSARPLVAVQVRDIAGRSNQPLVRSARMGTVPPFAHLTQIDDLAAEADAAALEIDAVFADYLRDVDPELRHQDLAALSIAGPHPVSHDLLRAQGVSGETISHLAERGYLVGNPAWWAPAAALIEAAVPEAVLDPATSTRCALWVGAVARGTLSRAEATGRAMNLLEGLPRPTAPKGFDGGRLIGPCPECGDWMGGAREAMRCMGCGLSYRLPQGVEALAMPGISCSSCAAPMIRPVVRGSVRPPRCPDAIGCPTNTRSASAR